MARIPEEELQRLKREVSVEQLVRTKGVELKKHGKDLIGLCPFHDDKSPSFVVSPAKNLWHCLGACGQGGSVVDFVMKAEGVSFRHAVELLREDLPVTPGKVVKVASVPKLPPLFDGNESDEELLEKVARHYHEELTKSDAARSYLERRGLYDDDTLGRFQVGVSERTLGYRMPQKNREAGARVRGRLMQLGVLRDSGHEHFRGSVVVPVRDRQGRIVQLYGRRIGPPQRGGSAHLYLPRPLAGVFNFEGIRDQDDVILCESIFDALTFHAAGFHNVTCSFGVNGVSLELIEGIKLAGAKRVYIAYDRDEAGEKGVRDLVEGKLLDGLEAYRVLFPRGMDANEYATKVQPARKALEVALQKAEWLGVVGGAREPAPASDAGVLVEPIEILPADDEAAETEPLPLAAEEPAAPAETAALVDEAGELSHSAGEVVLTFGDRRYRVRGLEKNTAFDVMKVNLLAAKGTSFHVDTFDLYAARHRAHFVKQAADELAVKESVIKRDVGRVLLRLEELQDELIKQATEPKAEAVTMTDDERAEALALLTAPDLVERILSGFEAAGVVGEETNKLVGYLAAVSRKLEQPLAVVIQSSSAAGKSSLMDAVLAFVPDEDRVKYSAMTGQSLFYMGESDIKHKILAIVEEEGAERAAYALKLLQSEGELSIASTGKDPQTGRLVTQEYRVEGPVMIFLTTTAIEVDEELMNRCLVLSVSEDREQTRAIHRLQRERQTLEGLLSAATRDDVLRVHKNAQRLLEPVLVANPFARGLSFIDHKTRTRRDHMKYLTLIRTIALLFQHQRERKRAHASGREVEYIEVQPQDIELANRLCREVLGRSLDELPPQTRRLLLLLDDMVSEKAQASAMERSEVRFTRREAKDRTGFGHTQLRIHLERLVEMEYVLAHRGSQGQRFVYELVYEKAKDGESGSFLPGLLDAAVLGAPATSTNATSRGQEAHFAGGLRAVRGPVAASSRAAAIAEKLKNDATLPANAAPLTTNARSGQEEAVHRNAVGAR